MKIESKKAKAGALLGAGLVSLCCGIPLLLAFLGVAGMGFGNFLGDYHWFLTGGGILAILTSWYFYIRERKKDSCETCVDETAEKQNQRTRFVLIGATLFVGFFTLWDAYTYLGPKSNMDQVRLQGKGVEIAVTGMTCASCELHVESSIRKLPGIYAAKASAANGVVFVDFDPNKTNESKIMAAINDTGYKAVKVLKVLKGSTLTTNTKQKANS